MIFCKIRKKMPSKEQLSLQFMILSIFSSICNAAPNTSTPIVIVNNHNHTSDSLLEESYESDFTTGSALSSLLSTGSVLTLDELPNITPNADPGPSSSPANVPLSSSVPPSSSSYPALYYTDQQHSLSMSASTNHGMTAPPPLSSSNNKPAPANTTDSDGLIYTSPDSHRPRWVDYRSRPSPAFPPRVPGIHGIPSGFRNPVPAVTPAYGTQTVHNPQLVHNFGGSSTNPVGFAGSVPPAPASFPASNANQDRRRPMINITRVEHIAAECSDEYMKVTIHYNGTFTGLIYSSGYVHDPNCIYVNGTGRNHYEFFIRLNQCGTLGRQEMYHPKRPGEVRRRDQVMWNTLSIQYNPMIEEEWDEHYRVTCEYGSDFWKTVTFPAVNVEVNTGSPVVFTINPPQCQMEVRRGFGIAGSRTSGPVTVGDPLTLLIHMKSEKAGFDILVKNCIAHNGAQQKLQLIDPNGCVTNEKLISPFRGTYNTDDGHQVSLYAYLKAFRFTGSPALYLECDIHMCHNKCPPQRCYWRNLSKRSVRSILTGNDTSSSSSSGSKDEKSGVMSESISLFQALEVRHEPDESQKNEENVGKQIGIRDSSSLCFRPDGVVIFGLIVTFILISSTTISVSSFIKMKRIRKIYHLQNEGSLYKHPALSYENLCHQTNYNRRRF